MIAARPCSKPGCTHPSVATLTFNYHDSMAVLGPLATSPEPHTYDLCEQHATSLTVPVGWQIVRLQTTYEPAPPSSDDLLALVDAVRAAAHSEAAARSEGPRVSEASRPRPGEPTAQERPAYATVTQLRPISGNEARSHEVNVSPARQDSPSSEDHAAPPQTVSTAAPSAQSLPVPTSTPRAASPISAVQFVGSELGPFAQPRPALPEESAITTNEPPEGTPSE